MRKEEIKEYNIVITGVGGMGVISLGKIIGEAASIDNYKLNNEWTIKSSEIHAMAQRGGSISCLVRLGTKVYSPLVPENKADLIVSLELIEGLREDVIQFAKPDKSTVFLIDEYKDIPQLVTKGEGTYPSIDEIIESYDKLSNQLFIVPATKIAIETGDIIMANIAMLGFMAKYVPINIKSLEYTIKANVPIKTIDTNIGVFKKSLNFKI